MQFMPGPAAWSFDLVYDNVAYSSEVLKYLLFHIFLSFKIIGPMPIHETSVLLELTMR